MEMPVIKKVKGLRLADTLNSETSIVIIGNIIIHRNKKNLFLPISNGVSNVKNNKPIERAIPFGPKNIAQKSINIKNKTTEVINNLYRLCLSSCKIYSINLTYLRLNNFLLILFAKFNKSSLFLDLLVITTNAIPFTGLFQNFLVLTDIEKSELL